MPRQLPVLVALLLAALLPAARAEPPCTLTVEPREVRAGEPVTVKLELFGESTADLQAVLSAGLPASLEVTSRSTQMTVQIVSGQQTTRRSATFAVVARKAGKVAVGPLAVDGARCGEKTVLHVRPAPKGPPAQPAGAAGQLTVSVDPPRLWVGDAASLRVGVAGVQGSLRLLEVPVSEGAYVERLDGPDALRLVPLWPGEVTVGPVAVEVPGPALRPSRRLEAPGATFPVAPRAGGGALATMQRDTPDEAGPGVAVLLVRADSAADADLAVRLARELVAAGMEVAVVRGAPSTVLAEASRLPDHPARIDERLRDTQRPAALFAPTPAPVTTTTALVAAAEALRRPGPRVLVSLAPVDCSPGQLGCASLARVLKLLGVRLLRPATMGAGAPGEVVRLDTPVHAAAVVERIRRSPAAPPAWKDLAGTWVPELLRAARDAAEANRLRALDRTAPTLDL